MVASGAHGRLAWALAGLTVALLCAARALSGVVVGSSLFITAIALVFSGVGALVASRHPANAVGWLFLGVGVSTGLASLAGSYGEHWTRGGGGPRALGELAAWYGSLSWIPFILVPCTFVLLLFPDGRLLSPRWRWVSWCAGLGIAGVFVGAGVHPGPIEDFPQLDNPFGVDSPLVEPFTGLAALVVLAAILGSAASVIARFRRA